MGGSSGHSGAVGAAPPGHHQPSAPAWPWQGRKQRSYGRQRPSVLPGLPWPPLQSTLDLGFPHLAAWCWDGASLGSVHHRWSGVELLWLPTGQGSRKISRTPCTHSPSMPWQCTVWRQGQLRGTGVRRLPAQPCPKLSWDRTCAPPWVLAGLWNSVTPVSTWGHPHRGSSGILGSPTRGLGPCSL